MTHARTDTRKRSSGESRYRRAAVIGAVALTLATVFVFTRQSLFTGGYQIHAVFSSANQLRGGSEVRTAGVKIGQVDGIASGPRGTSTVAMTIDDAGRPIHADATLTVKPRLLLEGNAYIDVNPGTPAAPELHAGATVPLTRTAITVQLDQVLDVFDSPTRGALQRSIAGLASGLGDGAPSGSSARGSGYVGLRQAVRELDGALSSVTQVARAARGTERGDLGRAIGYSGDVTAQLAQDPQALADSVTAFHRVMGALADQDRALAATVSGFDGLLRVAPPSLAAIDAALPSLTNFANALRPAMRAAPATLGRTNRLLDQIAALVQPAELPALLDRLAPVTTQLPRLERRLRTLFGYTTRVTDCLNTHVIPVLSTKIQDGANSTGDPAWLDLLHAFTGFTSASTSFDGNAGTFRAGLAFGAGQVKGIIPGIGNVAGQMDANIQGVRPVWLGYGVEPSYRPDQPCASQPLPNLNAASGPPPNWDLHRVSTGQAPRSR